MTNAMADMYPKILIDSNEIDAYRNKYAHAHPIRIASALVSVFEYMKSQGK